MPSNPLNIGLSLVYVILYLNKYRRFPTVGTCMRKTDFYEHSNFKLYKLDTCIAPGFLHTSLYITIDC